MEGILKVTPDKLILTSNEFSSEGNQIKTLTQSMLDTVNGLKSIWQGDAANAYSTKFNALSDDIEKMNRMINEHVQDLNEMARVYQQAENANVEDSNALQADVIQ